MIQRTLAMQELEIRIKTLWNDIGLKKVFAPLEGKLSIDKVPCIIITENDDIIEKRASGIFVGYTQNRPAFRVLIVEVECWHYTKSEVISLYEEARRVALQDSSGRLIPNVTIRENKADGPYPVAELDDAHFMDLYLEIRYPDEGPVFI